MRWDQVSGIADRVVIAALMWAVGKGYIAQSEVANIAALVLTVLGALWGYWVNRDKAIVRAAANIPETTVVTTPELASSTPERNIVSSAANRVVTR